MGRLENFWTHGGFGRAHMEACPMKKRLWHCEGLNFLRHRVGEYFWSFSAFEARERFAQQFGGVPSRVEVVR